MHHLEHGRSEPGRRELGDRRAVEWTFSWKVIWRESGRTTNRQTVHYKWVKQTVINWLSPKNRNSLKFREKSEQKAVTFGPETSHKGGRIDVENVAVCVCVLCLGGINASSWCLRFVDTGGIPAPGGDITTRNTHLSQKMCPTGSNHTRSFVQNLFLPCIHDTCPVPCALCLQDNVGAWHQRVLLIFSASGILIGYIHNTFFCRSNIFVANHNILPPEVLLCSLRLPENMRSGIWTTRFWCLITSPWCFPVPWPARGTSTGDSYSDLIIWRRRTRSSTGRRISYCRVTLSNIKSRPSSLSNSGMLISCLPMIFWFDYILEILFVLKYFKIQSYDNDVNLYSKFQKLVKIVNRNKYRWFLSFLA